MVGVSKDSKGGGALGLQCIAALSMHGVAIIHSLVCKCKILNSRICYCMFENMSLFFDAHTINVIELAGGQSLHHNVLHDPH